MTTPPIFRAGERWTYRAPAGFEHSRIIVGAVVTFTDREPVICCAVVGAPARRSDGSIETATIPFLPLSASALAASVVAPDGEADLPAGFAAAFETWRNDPRGLSVFTVAFEGSLETLIAKQMADIVGVAA
ncbi:MAG TPA: hypothetical protein VF226_22070 [Hyphomicrobiaceae bacterium]|jgi:hypothetical protein